MSFVPPYITIALNAAQVAQDALALKKSIEHEQLKKHLALMVDEHYAFFYNNGYFESVEFAQQFVAAARAAGRKMEASKVENWIEEQNTHNPY